MKAIGFNQSLPITDKNSLIELELPTPSATGNDLLIKVQAIAVNPVDYKVRLGMPPEDGLSKILGWDAVGEVVAVGEKVTKFKNGDIVFYAGDLNRQGSNAEYQLVDERIVGHKPKNLSNTEAAALPLTAITAWEMLFDHLNIKQQEPGLAEKTNEVILVVGAAGGVGSILIQIAKAITGATIIATASRPSSQDWVKNLGADYVINHTQELQPQIEELIKNKDMNPVTHIASLNSTENYFESYPELLSTFGKIAMIDDPSKPLDTAKLKLKSQSLHIEFMFARSMFNAPDMEVQGMLLNRIADLVDTGHIKTTLGKNLGIINVNNLKAAHTELETGKSIGKLVLEGF